MYGVQVFKEGWLPFPLIHFRFTCLELKCTFCTGMSPQISPEAFYKGFQANCRHNQINTLINHRIMQLLRNYVLVVLVGVLPLLSGAQPATIPPVSDLLSTYSSRAGLTGNDVSDYTVETQYTDNHNGVTHIYLHQQYSGIPIRNAVMGLHLDSNGELLTIGSSFVADLQNQIGNTSASLSAGDALEVALQEVGISGALTNIIEQNGQSVTFAAGALASMDITVSQYFQPDNSGQLQLSWVAGIYTLDQSHYWEVAVDAGSGVVLDRVDRVITCTFDHLTGDADGGHEHTHAPMIPRAQEYDLGLTATANRQENFYRVYDYPIEAPTFGERTLVKTGGDPIASPLGWHNDGITEYTITRGNNTYSYVDPTPGSVGIPTAGGVPLIGTSPLVFDFPIDFTQNPTLYKDAAVTNLFYWNNLIHDIFYNYGFTEPSGNFQWNNLNRGGSGMDAVLAEAQDGSGVNNANFLTLPDGLPGRMQMFLWNTAIPLIDGDLDNGVIVHEYGHGISTRLTGGPNATCLGGDEQGGEGWSDYFGLLLTMDPNDLDAQRLNGRGIGTYVLAEGTDGGGIRPAKYSTDFAVNDYTYGDIDNSEISVPHGVGFIWCTMLNDLTWALIDKYGYDEDIANGNGGNNIALQLVTDGLKLQPCSPTFVEMRDAILMADQINNNGENLCLLWEAFARRGLGFSAESGTNARGDEVEAFDMPPAFCKPVIQIETTTPGLAVDGENLSFDINLINNSSEGISGITIENTLPDGLSFVSSSQRVKRKGNELKFKNLSVGPNTTHTITVTVALNVGSAAQMVFRDDLENGPFNWETNVGVNAFTWSNTDAFSGEYSFFAVDPDNFSNQTLTLANSVSVEEGLHLRFAHRFNTEKTFDGGVLEFSTDGGVTWNDGGSLIVSNGYNDLINAVNNTLINGFAFGGQSDGFIHTLADLSPLAGQDVQLRFRFASDVATGQEGWYIDDMELVTDPAFVTNTITFTQANGKVGGQEIDEILVLANGATLASAKNPTQATNPSQATTINRVEQGVVTGTGFGFEAMPNPATDQVTLFFTGQVEGNLNIRVMTMDGRTVQQFSQGVDYGAGSIRLNVSDLAEGMYLIQAENGQSVQTQKLVVRQ